MTDARKDTPRHVAALDGVRAVAVVLVVLFHLRVPGFEAGFLGVDVFFVLSGFLITSLVLDEIDRTGRISLPAFWARRIRRLLPALVVVLLTVATVTWMTGSFSERSSTRSDLIATSAYLGNWRFIDTSSYFNSTGTESPLEHTWSLAIEEQFYLVWPIALILVGLLSRWRCPRVSIGVLAGVGAVASVILLAARWDPSAVERAYMGTDSRVFEPLLGALSAAIVAAPAGKRLLARTGSGLTVVGATGLIAALFVIRPQGSIYYRGGALFVSVMTVAVVASIWAGRGGRIRRGLSWAPIAWIGAASYGIYLWHWPVTLWLGLREPSPSFAGPRVVVAFMLTIAIAAVSFYVVEQPFRRHVSAGRHARRQDRTTVRWALAAAPVTLLVVAGISMVATAVPPPAPSEPVVMLVGDSVPNHLQVTLEEHAEERGWRIVSAAHGSCPVTGETVVYQDGTPVRDSDGCSKVVAEQDGLIDRSDPNLVLWWDRWSVSSYIANDGRVAESGSPDFWRGRRQALRSAVARLGSAGATVVFVAVEPPGTSVASRCTDERCNEWVDFQVTHYDDITTRWNELLASFAERYPRRASFITITDIICTVEASPCDDTLDGIPARSDGTHYEGAGAELAADSILRLLAPELSTSRSDGTQIGTSA